MFCQKCGEEIPNDALFCPECGEKQDLKPVEAVNSVQETNVSPNKYCTNCGSKIPSDSKFCPECSAKQDDVAPVPEVQPQVTPSQPQAVPPQPQAAPVITRSPEEQARIKKRNKIIGIVIGAIVVACAAIGAFLLLVKPTINLNEYLTVSFEGYNTVGKAVVTFDYEKFEQDYEKKLKEKTDSDDEDSVSREFLSDCVEGTLDKDSGLSNGDVVTYTWNCNDEKALENYGYKLKYENIEYTVSNLEEAETFDPFDGINVVFSGISPEGSASIDGEPNATAAEDLRFDFDKSENLSNGDVVTVTVTMYDDDPVEYCIENYGKIPSPLTKTYTVKDLNSYVRATSDISAESINEMQKQADDVYKANVAQTWGDDETLKSLTYLGTYLLTNKSSDNYGGYDNMLYLVYNAKVKNQYSNDGQKYNKTNDIYWYIAYHDLLVNSNGETTVDITSYNTPSNTFTIESGVSDGWWSEKSWYYYGYQTLDELYNAVVISNLESYNHEDKVNDSVTPAEKEEKSDKSVSGKKGIIFPNSSKELLKESEIKKLSDKDLQSAINELYARNGYIFKDKKIKEFYEQYDWYKETVKPKDFKNSLFNKIEKKNIEILQKERDKRK